MAVTAGVTRSVPPTNPPAIGRIGRIMKDLGVWKVENIRDEITAVISYRTDGNEMTILYENSDGKHEARVHMSRHGTAECTYCTIGMESIAWCSHIRHLAQTRNDYPLYHLPPRLAFDEGYQVYVPVVPTEGIFIPVHLSDNRYRGHGVEIRVPMRELKEPAGQTPLLRTPVAAVLEKDFGSLELRSVLVDFLWGWMKNPEHFHQTRVSADTLTPIEAARAQRTDMALSEFSTCYHRALLGISIGEYQVLSERPPDSPSY